MLVAVLGGLLGILMMIPLRRALIVQQHGMLKYPEGTACAEVLKAGASRGIARGGVAGSRGPSDARARRGHQRAHHLHRLRHRPCLQDAQCRLQGLEGRAGQGLRRAAQGRLGRRRRSRPSCSASATSSARASPRMMCAGGVLAYLLLIPMIMFFGEGMAGAAGARHACPIARDEPGADPRRLRALHRRRRGGRRRHHQPVALAADDLARHASAASRDVRAARDGSGEHRTARDQDLSMKFVGIGIAGAAGRHHAGAAAAHEPAGRAADRRCSASCSSPCPRG